MIIRMQKEMQKEAFALNSGYHYVRIWSLVPANTHAPGSEVCTAQAFARWKLLWPLQI